jgi:hypothetical protein
VRRSDDDATLDGTTAAGAGRHGARLANYGAAALVFGQFVGERGVSWRLIAFGVLFWVASVATTLAIEEE